MQEHSKYRQLIGTNVQGKIGKVKTSDRQPQTDLLSLLYLCVGVQCRGSEQKAWASEPCVHVSRVRHFPRAVCSSCASLLKCYETVLISCKPHSISKSEGQSGFFHDLMMILLLALQASFDILKGKIVLASEYVCTHHYPSKAQVWFAEGYATSCNLKPDPCRARREQTGSIMSCASTMKQITFNPEPRPAVNKMSMSQIKSCMVSYCSDLLSRSSHFVIGTNPKQ